MALEDYLEFLDRIESMDEVGVGEIVRAMGSSEGMTELLDRVGIDASDARVETLIAYGQIRYEQFVEQDIRYDRIEQDWGYQSNYRDTNTGRFISRSEVENRLGQSGSFER